MSQTKVIIVTGANKGIGLEIVRGLANLNKEGVIIGTARHQDLAEKALKELKQTNGITNVKFEILDLKDSHSIEHFAKSIISKYDHLDVLVNNAAIFPLTYSAGKKLNEIFNFRVISKFRKSPFDFGVFRFWFCFCLFLCTSVVLMDSNQFQYFLKTIFYSIFYFFFNLFF